MKKYMPSKKEGRIKKLCLHKGEEHLKKADKTMAAILDRHGPCSLTARTDYFKVLCESIISQQLSVKAADTIFGRFCDLFDGGSPEPLKLLSLSDDEIRRAGISKQKAVYLKDLANKVQSGEISPDEFQKMEDEDIIRVLTTVKGIGRWTAEMFLIFALNRSDVLPTDDLGLKKAVQHQYRLKELPESCRIKEIAARWHPYATLATWYLWKSIGNK
jgi:DNA-3-methyladenine glycosylase II